MQLRDGRTKASRLRENKARDVCRRENITIFHIQICAIVIETSVLGLILN